MQPPNISFISKEATISEDSSSMKNSNSKSLKYKDFTLKISSPIPMINNAES
jgi:hypothetical protein